MAKFGHLQEFDTDLEPITAYLERVELYFSANGIGEDKKLAILLSVIGPKTYGVLRNLLAPSRPQEKKFSEVTEVLIRHFEPKLIVIAERFSFYRRSQLVGESVADFVAELRRLAIEKLPIWRLSGRSFAGSLGVWITERGHTKEITDRGKAYIRWCLRISQGTGSSRVTG